MVVQTGEWMTLAEAAERCRCSVSLLRQWIRSGRLQAIRPSGKSRGRFLISGDSLQAALLAPYAERGGEQ